MKNATCRNGLAQLGVNFGLTNDQIQEAMDAGKSRDPEKIKELSPEQVAWLDAQILAKKGLAPIMFGNETWGDKIYKELSDDEKSKIQGYPIPEPLPTLPRYEPLDPDKLGPNHTGHDEILQPFEPLPGYEPLDPDKLGPNHTGGDEIPEKDWRDFILTNQDKSFVDYKGDLNKGDQIDLSKFTDRQKISGGKANYVDPKTGWILSPDRAGANSHGGSAWKLIDKKGNRIATLDKNGNVLRK